MANRKWRLPVDKVEGVMTERKAIEVALKLFDKTIDYHLHTGREEHLVPGYQQARSRLKRRLEVLKRPRNRDVVLFHLPDCTCSTCRRRKGGSHG